MADCKIDITNSDPKWIARQLRKCADQHDGGQRWKLVLAFIAGMITLAAMDYGDVWLCVGDCPARPVVALPPARTTGDDQ